MSIDEKLKIEHDRTIENLLEINFFKEGEFWGAYDWSVYLATTYNEISGKSLKITHKKLKSGVDYITIGLKLDSFKKFFPNAKIEKDMSADHFCFKCENISIGSVEEANELLKKLLDNTPYAESKNKKEDVVNIDNSNKSSTLLSVMSEVLSYDTDNKSAEDLRCFIKSIRNKILGVLI